MAKTPSLNQVHGNGHSVVLGLIGKTLAASLIFALLLSQLSSAGELFMLQVCFLHRFVDLGRGVCYNSSLPSLTSALLSLHLYSRVYLKLLKSLSCKMHVLKRKTTPMLKNSLIVIRSQLIRPKEINMSQMIFKTIRAQPCLESLCTSISLDTSGFGAKR